MDFLKRIIQNKIDEIENKKIKYPLAELKKEVESSPQYPLKFKIAISIPHKINLIAEIKQASPSHGILRDPFNLKEITAIYATGRVSAISVLTETLFFRGNIKNIKEARSITVIPILMKDFILDEYQIYEAKIHGASAVLLIAAILSKNKLKDLKFLAHQIGLDCLVEVHDEEDIKKALDADAEIIGINNRNLKTFHVDLHTSMELKKSLPEDKITVSESGIKNKEDILRLKDAGFNAVLIGESFMKSPDIALKIKELWH
ncbi:indole-3-glycerol phosphate synthase TrpC [Candidatus Desantisbacteria bacterium]|nr:indole-3-glycerol phosphate synthase TrpC [Candidatus Desantisbacteria bacterium]